MGQIIRLQDCRIGRFLVNALAATADPTIDVLTNWQQLAASSGSR
jgi:hypothetical protein